MITAKTFYFLFTYFSIKMAAVAFKRIPRSGWILTGIVPSKKSVGRAYFQGTLERNLIRQLNFDPRVQQFEVQPFTMQWKDAEGRGREYTPDVRVDLVQSVNGKALTRTIIIEVKPRTEDFEPDEKVEAVTKHCAEQGWSFQLCIAAQIDGPFYHSLEFLRKYQRTTPAPKWKQRILDDLRLCSPTTLKEMCDRIRPDPAELPCLRQSFWAMALAQELYVDMQSALTEGSKAAAANPEYRRWVQCPVF